jgi:D-glycero-alpha-D-manno-heptose-7-phosphate kinase
VDQIRHPIVREALKLVGLDIPLDIATMADVPAGNGLGSSGTFSVALLHALHLVKGEDVGPAQLASEAAQIEIYRLDRPVGKQDHYAAAYGGFNVINFHADGGVEVKRIGNSESLAENLFPNLLLLHTGVSRDAGEVLMEQRENSEAITEHLLNIRSHAEKLQQLFENGFQAESLGEVMHESWMRKRQLSPMVSTGPIDRWYETAVDAGALGGKVCGAGGGGFLLLVVEPAQRQTVRDALSGLSELSIGYEPVGSTALLPH